jgi:glycosyltransferase involved in cell wall biosynthesis
MLWDELGGLDERFNPGPANDPDLFYRLALSGVEMIRAEDALVYHFSGKSSRMADEAKTENPVWHEITERNEGRFLEKWGERYQYANGGLPAPGPAARRRWTEVTKRTTPADVTTPLRVLFDARSIGPHQGGIGVCAENLIRALSKLTTSLSLTCLSANVGWFSNHLRGLENVCVERREVPVGDRKTELNEINRILAGEKFHVFHGPSFSLPQRIQIASVVTVHDLAFLSHPEWYPKPFVRHLSQVLDESLAVADWVIAVSDCTRRDLVRKYPELSSRIERIYEASPEGFGNDVSRERIAVAKERYGGQGGFVLSVGVQQRRKNALRLVRAFAKAREKSGLRQRLVLVGGKECEDPDLVPAITSAGLESIVQLTPYLPQRDLEELYSACDLFVYPSLFEGFGLPVLEAMACGAPVLTSNAGSLPEVAGEAARTFHPEDLDLLAASLGELLLDPSLREKLASLSRRRCEQFSWTKAAEETLGTYRKAVQSHAPPVEAGGSLMPAESSSQPRSLPARRRTSRPRVAVDSRLLGQKRLGTGRYTGELLNSLLDIARDADFVLIGPEKLDLSRLPKEASVLQHIPAGLETLCDPLWEQYSLPTHLLGCDVYFAPTGIIPVARPCKAVPVIHDLGFLDHPEHFDSDLRGHLERWIRNSCLSADLLISVSRFTKDRLKTHYGIVQERIRVVHHGKTDIGFRSPSSPSSSRSLSKWLRHEYVLAVSSFEPNKNLILLIDAFGKVSRDWPGSLVLAGRAGRELGAIRDFVRTQRMESRIEIVVDPGDDELANLYQGACLFAFPSLYEGFGLPLLEAMSAGLPVIASRAASCPEVIEEGGLLLEDPSPEAWAGAMTNVLTNPSLRSKLSQSAMARASTFSWTRAASETWSALLDCLERQ